MSEITAQMIAEFRALGLWCIIHGPEIWFGLAAWCVISGAVLIGMWLAALLSANKEDDDR